MGDNWRALLSISAAFVFGMIVIVALLSFLVSQIFTNAAGATVIGSFGTVIFLLFALVLSGAVTRLIASELVGEPITVSESISWGMAHLGPIVVVALLVAAISLAVSIVGTVLDGLTDSTLFSTILGLVQLAISVLLSMAIPALVVEGIRGSAALSRSLEIVKPHFWHALGTFALAYLAIIAGAIVASIFIFLGPLVVLAYFALFLFLLPFFSLVTVRLYVNLRVKAGGTTQGTLREELARNV